MKRSQKKGWETVQSLFVDLLDDSDFAKLEEKEFRFNVFDALGVRRQELRHSDFLAYLLDPQRPHGLGDRFLRAFLIEAAPSNIHSKAFSPLSIRLASLDDVKVERERSHVDITIEDPGNWMILIENKIDAKEHGGQLRSYKEFGLNAHDRDRLLLLYLTPAGERPSDDDWVAISHHIIRKLANGLAHSDDVPKRTRFVLEDYADFVEGYILEDSRTADLCRTIYQKHKEAIDLLFEHLPSQKDIAIQMATSVVKRLEMENVIFTDTRYRRIARFYDAELASGLPRVSEGAWTNSNVGILFEWEPRQDGLYLDLVVGPIEGGEKERVLQALERSDKELYQHVKLSSTYCHVAQERIIDYDAAFELFDTSDESNFVSSVYDQVRKTIERHRMHLKSILEA